MAIEIQITRIAKDNGNHENPYEAVEKYEWYQPSQKKQSIASREVMVGWLDNGIDGEEVKAYVERVQPRAYCYVNESAHHTRFLQTKSDATPENNLLRLDEI